MKFMATVFMLGSTFAFSDAFTVGHNNMNALTATGSRTTTSSLNAGPASSKDEDIEKTIAVIMNHAEGKDTKVASLKNDIKAAKREVEPLQQKNPPAAEEEEEETLDEKKTGVRSKIKNVVKKFRK
mmetsp:Transcript_14279/g.21313  ORF Transcript_14279/g.21313 Transcript_14279/m.21313 type:complete len:126 (+) Transcript_14279:135-512(+)